MLLNIDRVLQLLAEGKDLNKISEISKLPAEQISTMILDARDMLNKYDKAKVRKKVILKKGSHSPADNLSSSDSVNELFEGAELNAIPVNALLNFNIAVSSGGDFFKAGIVISDEEEKQIGKLHFKLIKNSEKTAAIEAISKSIEVASYFSARAAKFRISDSTLVKIINLEIRTENKTIQKNAEMLNQKLSAQDDFRVEYISSSSNEKTEFLARQRVKSKRPKDRK
ncbi:MAG: hypothetical protein JW982_15090 [Spirochaetes bacterium]|nr:hypothetical protein [Spirochaetota bacterium]